MASCPDSAVLRKLEAGELSDDQADQLTPHLLSCRTCARKLEELRSHDLDARIVRAATSDGGCAAVSGTPAAAENRASAPASHVWDIPDYERVRLCGEGAFGSVWAVRNRVGIYRALKLIDLGRLRELEVRCRESTALETYCRHVQRHPNLIEIFHVGVRGELLYYIMELADDDSTRTPLHDTFPKTYRPLTLQRLMEHGPISVDASIEIAVQLLRGLSRLHALDLAHRDIKPANIVFVGKRPKLADIGMITTETDSPSRVGTPHYMPPDEQMDLTADVFAMGRILHQLLAGAFPDQVPAADAEFLGPSDRWNTKAIRSVLQKACAPLAEQRYQRSEQMLEAIEASREMSYDSLFAQLGSVPQPPPAQPRNPYVPIIAAAIRALPWVIGLFLVLYLVHKYL